MKPIDKAIDLVGGRQKLATACGVSYTAVQKWRTKVPAEKVPVIAAATGYRVPCAALRPDLFSTEAMFGANQSEAA